MGRVGMFGGKSGIVRRILGVLGRMRTGCVGIEVEHLFQKKRLGGGRCLSHLPPISSNHHQVAFFDAFTVTSKDFLSHCILTRITTCTDKKRVLFGTRDVDCDSTHSVTTLSLPVVVFEMLGSI